MFGEIGNIPTNTLIDMLAVILARERILTLTDIAELEHIQCELQLRAQNESWGSYSIN